MYILKNAVTSIMRNKGRNLLIGIIILVISCAASVTLAINNSSTNLIESYKDKYEVEATLGVNRDNMMGKFNPEDMEGSREEMQEMFSGASQISVDDVAKYGDSEYVKSYYYTISTGVNSDDIEAASMSSGESDDTNNDMGGFGGGKPGGDRNFRNETSGDFTLKGYSSIEAMNEFIEGKYKISDGEVSEDFSDNSCLINSELATLNEVKVGDTIVVIDPEDESKTYELVVSGIFEEETSDDSGMAMFSDSVNTIITNTNILNKMSEGNSELMISITPTFTLTNSDVVEKFEEELQEKGLSEYLGVQTNLDQVEGATSTISNVKNFAITFLIITLVIGVIILLVINMINIRERKYEIGVLRTIGMKKSSVSLQFLYELMIVAFMFLMLGAGVGSVISVPISNKLLESEISSSTEEINSIENNFGFGNKDGQGQKPPTSKKENRKFNGVADVQAFDSIDAVVDFKVLIQLLGIGLVITLISGVSSMISIQKFSPLTILKERS